MPKTIKMLIRNLVALFVIFSVSIAYASPINFKPFEVGMHASESVLYSSNVGYASAPNVDPEWGIRTSGNGSIGLPFGEVNNYVIRAGGDWIHYFDTDEYSHFDWNIAHSVDLVFNRWALNVHQTFDVSANPDTNELGIIGTNLIKKRIHSVGMAVTGDLGKLKLRSGLDYTYLSTNPLYNILDRDSYVAYLDAGAAITPFADVFTRYTINVTRRRKNLMNHSVGHNISTGIRGQLSPYLVGEASIGYAFVGFDKRGTAPNNTEFSGFVYSGSLTNRMSELTTQRLLFSLIPEPGYNIGHDFFKSYVTTYTINHSLNSKVGVKGKAVYIFNQEGGAIETRETSTTVKVGGGINYVLAKYVSLGFGYDFSKRTSDVAGKDFVVHEVTLELFHNF